MKKEIIVYLAGIIDGEGSIRIELQRGEKRGLPDYYRLKLSVANTSLELMNWLRDNFNGNPLKEKKRIGYRKQIYQWEVKSPKRALQIVEAIRPYLIVKKAQAKVAVELTQFMIGAGHRYTDEQRRVIRKLYEEMRELNKRGI